jgi:hypothetical protein
LLLLVTVGLLLASVALLTAGFAHDSVPLTYGAIGCAALAAVLPLLFNRIARNRGARQAASSPNNSAVGSSSSATTADRAPSQGRHAQRLAARPTVVERIAHLRTSSGAHSLRNRVPVGETSKRETGQHPPVGQLDEASAAGTD